MRRLLAFVILVAFAGPLFALDGVVLNGTTRQPQAGVEINLVQPGADGMQQIGATKSDAQGKFKIDKPIPPGPGLVQATYAGVTYNQIITPGMPTIGVEVKVYESTTAAGIAKAAEHLILLEPSTEQIKISETFVFSNETEATYNDPARGSARFFLPAGSVAKAQVVITAPGGMPISRPPIKTKEANIYKVDYPLKPGDTRIDLSYTAPPAEKFRGKIAPSDSSTHLVTPYGVTLTGDGIESAGQEPQSQANIYNLTGLDYYVLVEGFGSLRGDDQNAGSQEDNGSPKVEIKTARIYSRLGLILGLAFGILGLGGVMLYRRGTV